MGEQPVHLVLGLLLLRVAQVLERVPLGSEHRLWFSLMLGPHRRPPARGQRSPGACSGCTCRVTPPYIEHCSTVKNGVQMPWLCDLPTRTQRVGSPSLPVTVAQLSAGSRQPGVSLIEGDHRPSHRPGRRRPPRRPAARFSSNRGRPNTRVELTEPTVRIAALPVGLHPASSAAAPASPVRIDGARTHRSIRSARLRPMRPVMVCARWAASEPEGQVDQERPQPCPSDPLGTWSPFGCPGD